VGVTELAQERVRRRAFVHLRVA